MHTAERTCRLVLTLAAVIGAVTLFLPLFGIRADVVLSGSMEPALRTGGIVFTDTGRRQPDIGDIITYEIKGSCITHRVEGKDGQRFITRGDANETPDPEPVNPEQIVGTVVFSVPFLGYAAVFLQKETVFCLILAMIVQEGLFLAAHIIQQKGERTRLRGK